MPNSPASAQTTVMALLLVAAGCDRSSEEPRAAPAPAPAAASAGISPEAAEAQSPAEVARDPTPEGGAASSSDPGPSEGVGFGSLESPGATSSPETALSPESAPSPQGALPPRFSVIARLLDVGNSVPHCGIFHFKVVMKYEVLRVVDGLFEPAILFAAVSCPEMPPTRTRKFRWTVGETYELRLRTAGVRRGGALVDAFKSEPGKRYELLHIEPTPAP